MQRPYFLSQIDRQFRVHSVCGILGPRQVGKTTLAREYAKQFQSVYFFDLENPLDLARLDNPMLFLSSVTSDLIVIDEIQRRPELFPILRVLVDEKPRKFLILGSASRDLIQQSSETLAGRIGYIELPPFGIAETKNSEELLIRGGFPRSYLAKTLQDSYDWRQAYITTFMERDILSLGFDIPPVLMHRLWMMLAHNHGNILNSTDIGRSLSITHHTVRKYIDILAGTFMIRLLQPWFENISKRQVKSPKVYVRDVGLLNVLLTLRTPENQLVYSKLGALWEGFVLEEVINQYHVTTEECFFWATQCGAELDLLIFKDGKRLGFEFKYTDSPKITQSMHIAFDDLNLDHLYLVHPHAHTFPLSKTMTAVGMDTLIVGIDTL